MVEISFLRNSLAAIGSISVSIKPLVCPKVCSDLCIDFRYEAASGSAADETNTAPNSEQLYYQPENFAIYNEQANIYRDLDLEGFLSST